MVVEPHSQAFKTLAGNLDEIWDIQQVHSKIAGVTRGRKWKTSSLNKAGIVLLTAYLETYFENLALELFDFLVEHDSEAIFLSGLLIEVAKKLKSDPDHRAPLKLMGEGWKSELRGQRELCIKKYLETFNTPGHEKIDSLFEQMVGIKKISESWGTFGLKQRGRSLKFLLKKFIELRGDIAHKGSTKKTVLKSDVETYVLVVVFIVIRTDEYVARTIRDQLDKSPW